MNIRNALTPIVDAETGEVTSYGTAGVDRLLQQFEAAERQRNAYSEKKKREEAMARDQRHFLKVFESGCEIMSEASLADLGVLFKLTTSLYYGCAGLLLRDAGRDEILKPLKRSDLMKLLNKSKNGIDAAIERLERIGAIRKDTEVRPHKYYISEDLVSFGRGTGTGHFTKVYKTEAKRLLKQLTDREAGAIFKCLPYVHHRTHALVFNPHEKDLTKVIAIRGKELARILGLDYDSLTNLTPKLKRKGAMMLVDVGTAGKGYVINPYVCDRGYYSEYTEQARNYFTIFADKKNKHEHVYVQDERVHLKEKS
ncbi:hypothetical protein V7166_17835 [Bacillus thuringiensis]